MAGRTRLAVAMRGGTIAGAVGGLVMLIARLVTVVGVYALIALLAGSTLAPGAEAARGGIWVALKLAAYPVVGARALAPGFDAGLVTLGLAMHFAVSMAWGDVFGLIASGRSRATILALGLPFGLVVWLVMFYAVLPLVGAGALPHELPTVGVVAGHLLFGLTVAAAFLPFHQAAPGTRAPWAHRSWART